jgi:hypothetical protein
MDLRPTAKYGDITLRRVPVFILPGVAGGGLLLKIPSYWCVLEIY